MSRDFYRLLLTSDRHSGHEYGLPTPDTWAPEETALGKTQRELWRFYADSVDALKPIDGIIDNGDAIDGKGKKSGGTELATADRIKQCEAAAYGINYAEADDVGLIYGTPYHTGGDEDFEDVIAPMVHAKMIGGNEAVEINGRVIRLRHKLDTTKAPYHQYTAMAREAVQDIIKADEWKPNHKVADVLIFSHRHRFSHIEDGNGRHVFVTPSLQWHTKYGGRECGGLIHFGIMWLDIYNDGRIEWGKKVMNLAPLIKAPQVWR